LEPELHGKILHSLFNDTLAIIAYGFVVFIATKGMCTFMGHGVGIGTTQMFE
jgi:hypothetical protein